MQVKISSTTKIVFLYIVTAIPVVLVRKKFEFGPGSWESIEEFFLYWFASCGALWFVAMVTALVISFSRKFFLGYEHNGFSGDLLQIQYCVLITLFVATLLILLVSGFGR
jgi:hypothetical protein